jgi:hypothetical protein
MRALQSSGASFTSIPKMKLKRGFIWADETDQICSMKRRLEVIPHISESSRDKSSPEIVNARLEMNITNLERRAEISNDAIIRRYHSLAKTSLASGT